jgi:hypothetical protein
MAPDVVANSAVEAFAPASSSLRKAEELARYMDSLADAFARADNPFYYDFLLGGRPEGAFVSPYRKPGGLKDMLMMAYVERLARGVDPDVYWRSLESRESDREVLEQVLKLPPEFQILFFERIGVARSVAMMESLGEMWLLPKWRTPVTTDLTKEEERLVLDELTRLGVDQQASRTELHAALFGGLTPALDVLTEEQRVIYSRLRDGGSLGQPSLDASARERAFFAETEANTEYAEFNDRFWNWARSSDNWGDVTVALDQMAVNERRAERSRILGYENQGSNLVGTLGLMSGELQLWQQMGLVEGAHVTKGRKARTETDRLIMAAMARDIQTEAGPQPNPLPGTVLGGYGGTSSLSPEERMRFFDVQGSPDYGLGTHSFIRAAFDSVQRTPIGEPLPHEQVVRASGLSETFLDYAHDLNNNDPMVFWYGADLYRNTQGHQQQVQVAQAGSDAAQRANVLPVDGKPIERTVMVGFYDWGGELPTLQPGKAPAGDLVTDRAAIEDALRRGIQINPDGVTPIVTDMARRAAEGAILSQIANGGSAPTDVPAKTFGQGFAAALGAMAPEGAPPGQNMVEQYMRKAAAETIAFTAVNVAKTVPGVGIGVQAWTVASAAPGVPSPQGVISGYLEDLMTPEVYPSIEGEAARHAAGLGAFADEAAPALERANPLLAIPWRDQLVQSLAETAQADSSTLVAEILEEHPDFPIDFRNLADPYFKIAR